MDTQYIPVYAQLCFNDRLTCHVFLLQYQGQSGEGGGGGSNLSSRTLIISPALNDISLSSAATKSYIARTLLVA